MQASTAQIVDLQAYRRARSDARRAQALPAPGGAAMPLVWYPVWMFVPVVMVPQ